MKDKFELFAFYSNPKTLDELIMAGIDGIIVDWENIGKFSRQSLYNTQITQHSEHELIRVSNTNALNIICRINGPAHWSVDEMNKAIDLGATELLLPMIKNISEVEFVLNHVQNKIKVGLMLETNESLELIEEFNKMPIHRFFVGLNDLSIQRGTNNIFLPFIDGTIDKLRPKINKKFGIAGLTHPAAGHPISCSLLIHQMKKHYATFGILRRSFYKDLSTYGSSEILNAIRAEFVDSDYTELTSEQKHLFSVDLF